MTDIQHSVVRFGGQESLTALVDGKMLVATSNHPRYREIKAGIEAGDSDVAELFDIREAIRSAFGKVTDRVEVNEDSVTLDGVEVSGGIKRVMISLVEQGDRDGFIALARFLERLDANPSHRSREQLYNFVEANNITLDIDGNLVLYKGVAPDGEGGYRSIHQGRATVDGTEVVGYIPARRGSIITMERREISDDPNRACHAGLHAGAWDYASTFGGHSVTLRVLVGPEHVVCVPNDSSFMKIRCERYEILDIVTSQSTSAYWSGGDDWDEDEDDYEDEDYYEDDEDYEVEEEAQSWPPRSQPTVEGHTPFWNW